MDCWKTEGSIAENLGRRHGWKVGLLLYAVGRGADGNPYSIPFLKRRQVLAFHRETSLDRRCQSASDDEPIHIGVHDFDGGNAAQGSDCRAREEGLHLPALLRLLFRSQSGLSGAGARRSWRRPRHSTDLDGYPVAPRRNVGNLESVLCIGSDPHPPARRLLRHCRIAVPGANERLNLRAGRNRTALMDKSPPYRERSQHG
jgi:hypothetical protein